MKFYDKLNELVKKIEELDELSSEYDKLKSDDSIEHNKIRDLCLNQGALNAAEELEEIVEDFTDEDIEEMESAFGEIEDEIEAHEEEIAKIRKSQGNESPELIVPLHELAELYSMAQRIDEEVHIRKEVLKLLKMHSEDSKPNITAAMRELIFALKVAAINLNDSKYETEASLLRRQMFIIYKQVFIDETDEDVDILIDAMQFILGVIDDLEIMDKFNKAEVLYNKLFEVDIDIFEHIDNYNNLTPISATRTIGYTLYNLNLQAKAEEFSNMFPQVNFNSEDEEVDDENDDVDDSTVAEALAMEAINSLQCLANIWNEQGRFDEELNTRKRIVDIYYETFGEKEIWSIRTTMFEMQLLQELEDVLKNLKRRNEKLEVRKKIKKLEKKIEDYINKSPEQASQEIKALINENKY